MTIHPVLTAVSLSKESSTRCCVPAPADSYTICFLIINFNKTISFKHMLLFSQMPEPKS